MIGSKRSRTARASHFKVRSDFDSRIHPHPKNVCRSLSSSRSFSFRDSENEGRTSSPVRSLLRRAKEMQEAPFALREPAHEPGIQRNSLSIGCLVMMRAGVLQVAPSPRYRGRATRLSFRISRYGVNRTHVSDDFPRDYPRPRSVGLPRYEPVLGRPLRDGGASESYPTRNFATLGTFVTR
jgi:hypothetical protein